jgi:hypothetical protein
MNYAEFLDLTPKEWNDLVKIMVDEAGVLDDEWAKESDAGRGGT